MKDNNIYIDFSSLEYSKLLSKFRKNNFYLSNKNYSRISLSRYIKEKSLEEKKVIMDGPRVPTIGRIIKNRIGISFLPNEFNQILKYYKQTKKQYDFYFTLTDYIIKKLNL